MQTVTHNGVSPIEWTGASLRLLDQTRLPAEVLYVELSEWPQVAEAIREMRVRGAPAIGVAGAFGVALAARSLRHAGKAPFDQRLAEAADRLAGARPTAVNLRWAVARTLRAAEGAAYPDDAIARVEAEAVAIQAEDLAANHAIGAHGAALVPPGATLLTHCNAGALATAGYGTALGVVRSAWAQGLLRGVITTETRPLFQGARLTAWELAQDGISVTVVVDSAVGSLLRAGRVTVVVVGADWIAANGDVANKIGTYSLAVLARAHGVPLYVAAPTSTVDLETPDGSGIPVEERPALEISGPMESRVVPTGVEVLNPAFDVTPAEYVSAIITEAGVALPPYPEALEGMVARRD